jgi:hypothetical protein
MQHIAAVMSYGSNFIGWAGRIRTSEFPDPEGAALSSQTVANLAIASLKQGRHATASFLGRVPGTRGALRTCSSDTFRGSLVDDDCRVASHRYVSSASSPWQVAALTVARSRSDRALRRRLLGHDSETYRCQEDFD